MNRMVLSGLFLFSILQNAKFVNRNADVILVLKDGDILESGNHEQLLAQKGFYSDLYNSQFEEAS